MDKLKMHTPNKADENFKKLAALFSNAVTETINENREVVRAIDKDVLMQEISCKAVDGNEERYQFTRPDKKKFVLLANAPINKTLLPCREESVDFDNTEDLYIEGDNLEVLKLLQETYLGKIKMIYIDPSYDTGNDFVYEDDFGQAGKERIRRAAKKIAEENPDAKFDGGFRVLKYDSSNMKDFYYSPSDFDMNLLDMMADNIKEDRTPIAQKQPYYFVMRDSSLASDSVATNFEQIFATYSPDTVRKVL